jgi:hypothetical protein
MCSNNEAFGRVTVEAMLSGSLVIGSESAGTKELIIPFETGLLFKQNDIDDFVDKIQYALNDREVSRRIAKNGQAYMYNNMTAEKNAFEINKIYNKIKR